MRLTVFCGSASGSLPAYTEVAEQLGRLLAERGIGLVYGGASVGLMGSVANAALAAGGEVIGVIPKALASREIAHDGLTQLHVVSSMHERKAMMAELSDGFIALPGGAGTLEEIFEVWTWGQLGYHRKPCALFNVAGYYDALVSFVEQVVEQGFLKPKHREMLIVDDRLDSLMQRIEAYEAPSVSKWISHDQT